MRYANKDCPGCRKSKSLFKKDIQKRSKKDKNGKMFDLLLQTCNNCNYQFKDYSETDKPQHWGRAHLYGLT